MFRYLLTAGVFMSGTLVTAAQEQAIESRTYTPEDFAQYAPRTALDMVRQIPGFQVDEGDTSSRGFGQATGNILINGQRISGKSNTASAQLGRITAESVVKIEILDGASLDIPGLSGLVVNITTRSSGVSGTWKWRTQFREGREPRLLAGEVSASGDRGALEWTLSFRNNAFRNGHTGPEIVTDGTGALTEIRQEDAQYYGDVPSASLTLGWKPENGTVGNLNASYTLFDFKMKERSTGIPQGAFSGQPITRRLFTRSEDEWNSEVGGDYEFGLGSGRLKLIGLQRWEHSPTIATLLSNNEAGTSLQQSRFEQVADESESILRTEYSWTPRTGHDWQVSLEGAFNTLEIDAALSSLDASGVLIPVMLANASSTVEEKRAEITLTHSRTLSPKLSVQASAGMEFSELSQSGAAGLTREFTRPKGFVSAAWKVREGFTINAQVAREVGQLNFFDFIASVNLNNNNANAGNPDIVPEQSWTGEIEIERDYGDKGAGTLRIYGAAIEDIVDQVPIGMTGEAPGNLDSATRYGIEATGTVKLAPWGWKGAQIELGAEARQSAVDDPLTGVSRRINGDLVSTTNISFRQDIASTDWAWGFGFNQRRNARMYRLDQSFQRTSPPGWGWLFIEHKDVFGMTALFELGNLGDQTDRFQRDVYAPRRDETLLLSEDRKRTFGTIYTFNLTGSF